MAERASTHAPAPRADAWLAVSLLALLASAPAAARESPTQAADQDTERHLNLEERIEVLEEPWKVGDLKTYSLIFDYAPFGRQTIRLDRIVAEGGERILEFSQMLHLDLRALGQEGSLYNFGTIRYARGRMFRQYHFNEILKSWSGYRTYEPHQKMRERVVDIERSGDRAGFSVETGNKRKSGQLQDVGEVGKSILVDLEIIGHWERIFLFDTWELGQEKTIPMMVPSEPVTYDYHIPVKQFRPIAPTIKDVTLRIEALETVSVFSINIEAFRCRIPRLGYTLWVTPRGGVIKFDNGKGLTGMLER
ncbi:MAG: hypothetical protein ACE5HU_04245 [Acidobacteriota bacterium]